MFKYLTVTDLIDIIPASFRYDLLKKSDKIVNTATIISGLLIIKCLYRENFDRNKILLIFVLFY